MTVQTDREDSAAPLFFDRHGNKSVFTDINRLCHQPHIQKTAFDAVPDVFGVAAEDLIADTGISIPECRDAVRQNAGRQKLSAADGDGPFQVVLFI